MNRMNHAHAARIPIGFQYAAQIVDQFGRLLHDDPLTKNRVPQVGVDHIAGLIRGTGVPVSAWYVGLFAANFLPQAGTTAADLPGVVGEFTGYSEATRQRWEESYDGVSIISSLDNRAEFTFTQAARIHGAFLVSAADKGGNGGLLLSIARFDTPYDVPQGSVFRIGGSIDLIPAL